MANGRLDNVFLINAPAGSGKTTEITRRVINELVENPNAKILCITYTNRAADELKRRINNRNVFIGTIHRFFNSISVSLFSHKEIIDLFCETYKERILERIKNIEDKEHINESNSKYIEKYGELSYETVKNNIKLLSYGETEYTSYYYGILGHDDLIVFVKRILDTFPKIYTKISKKYNSIYLDEYQDSSADVLYVFYNAVKNTSCKLYLFGDKMQQIYSSYDGSFEAELEHFNTDIRLSTNYRSTREIIEVLNNLYNDENFKQKVDSGRNDNEFLFLPKVIITNSVKAQVEKISADIKDVLVLYVFNRERFEHCGSLSLFNALAKVKEYNYQTGSYTPVELLTDFTTDNPDPVLKTLWCASRIVDLFNKKKYGLIIKLIQNNKNVFNNSTFIINASSDKKTFGKKIELICNNFNKDCTIKQFLDSLINNDILATTDLNEVYDNEDYEELFSVQLSEFKNITSYLNNPNVSTQHGVKGEGHDSIVFVAENATGNGPRVDIYGFFRLWCNYDISLTDFEKFYFCYKSFVTGTINELKVDVANIKKDSFLKNKETIVEKLSYFSTVNGSNMYFKHFLKSSFEHFFQKPGVGTCKNCFKTNTVFDVLTAYRIFYVGCSRAKKNLCVIIDSDKIADYKDDLISKLKKTGFTVEEEIRE